MTRVTQVTLSRSYPRFAALRRTVYVVFKAKQSLLHRRSLGLQFVSNESCSAYFLEHAWTGRVYRYKLEICAILHTFVYDPSIFQIVLY